MNSTLCRLLSLSCALNIAMVYSLNSFSHSLSFTVNLIIFYSCHDIQSILLGQESQFCLENNKGQCHLFYGHSWTFP